MSQTWPSWYGNVLLTPTVHVGSVIDISVSVVGGHVIMCHKPDLHVWWSLTAHVPHAHAIRLDYDLHCWPTYLDGELVDKACTCTQKCFHYGRWCVIRTCHCCNLQMSNAELLLLSQTLWHFTLSEWAPEVGGPPANFLCSNWLPCNILQSSCSPSHLLLSNRPPLEVNGPLLNPSNYRIVGKFGGH